MSSASLTFSTNWMQHPVVSYGITEMREEQRFYFKLLWEEKKLPVNQKTCTDYKYLKNKLLRDKPLKFELFHSS